MGSEENDYSGYERVKKLYDEICAKQPDVIQEMEDLIDKYVDLKDQLRSTSAGRTIIPKHKRFQELCDNAAAQVFGVLLRKHLQSGWDIEPDPRGGKVYTRKP